MGGTAATGTAASVKAISDLHLHDTVEEELERERRDRRTLRFEDRELERAYQDETTPPLRERRRRAWLTDAPLWLIAGTLGPIAIGIDPLRFWFVAGGMIVVVIVSSYLSGRAPDRWWLDLNSVIAAAIASVAILILATVLGVFDRFAALGIGAAGVEVITTYRLSFVFALLLATLQLIAFTVVGSQVAAALPFQILLLFLVLGLTCWGTYISEDRERSVFANRRLVAELHRQVNALFHQYLSPDVADTLLAHPERAQLGGEVVEITVMFADLRDFTPFSEKTPPHTVVDMLNEAFSAAVPIVFAEGGTITQFAGDAIMAIYNAPVRQPDHALRAARTALALQEAVGAIPGSAERPQFRVGLSSGPALVGNIGSQEIRNFTAIGDTTNTAARLHAYAPAGGIVMSERTYELIRDQVEARPLGTPELKGKSPIEVYQLVALKAGLSGVTSGSAADAQDVTGDRPAAAPSAIA